jgi:hypothetical protein
MNSFNIDIKTAYSMRNNIIAKRWCLGAADVSEEI